MGKTKIYCYGFSLLISIAVNILFSVNMYVGGGLWGERKEEVSGSSAALTWSVKAAAEAEAVAAISCSGHGRAYVDGIISDDGQPVCECHGCYGGIDCSEFSPGCPADAHSGDLEFLEPFWMQNAMNSAVVISGWHRMCYTYSDDTYISTMLEKYVRRLHSVIGNAITEGRYMVFGVGSAQLLSAAIYALSSQNSSSSSTVLTSIPFYPFYELQPDLFNSKNFQFQGDVRSWLSNNPSNNTTDVIEFVTSPNNPDGGLKESVLNRKTIYDHVYYWPHFTPIPGPLDHDVMIFSLSKLTGHAGARFGWAVIKDKDVYEKFLNYIFVTDMGISKDTQLRALKLLKVVVEGDGKPLFEFAYKKMEDRWDGLTSVFSKSTRFSIQERHPLHCNYFNQTRQPLPAFAWVKCEREEDYDCKAVLEGGKIIGRSGSDFSVKDHYARLNVGQSQDEFELLMKRITELVSSEKGTIETM